MLENARDFPAGCKESYDFHLEVPTAAEARAQGGEVLREMSEKVGEGALGSIMKVAAGAASIKKGRLAWHVESRLDADGVDLFIKQKIGVNLKDDLAQPEGG